MNITSAVENHAVKRELKKIHEEKLNDLNSIVRQVLLSANGLLKTVCIITNTLHDLESKTINQYFLTGKVEVNILSVLKRPCYFQANNRQPKCRKFLSGCPHTASFTQRPITSSQKRAWLHLNSTRLPNLISSRPLGFLRSWPQLS